MPKPTPIRCMSRAFKRNLKVRLQPIRLKLQLRREFAADRRRFARYALWGESTSRSLTARNVEAQVTKDYHRVEKGLALAHPRVPFGVDVLHRLDELLPRLSADQEDIAQHALSARAALRAWNAGDSTRRDDVSPRCEDRPAPLADPTAFFESRHSVRHFATTPVPMEQIRTAVRLASSTPSVCNRQPWKVRLYSGTDSVKSVLSFQNGNAGFGETVPCVAVVTVDLRMFTACGERNQPWIDGGLFAMSFVWALHSVGIDSCMLNMSVLNDAADQLRDAMMIGDYELVIMMIAIGYGESDHRRARSPRRGVDEILVHTASD